MTIEVHRGLLAEAIKSRWLSSLRSKEIESRLCTSPYLGTSLAGMTVSRNALGHLIGAVILSDVWSRLNVTVETQERTDGNIFLYKDGINDTPDVTTPKAVLDAAGLTRADELRIKQWQEAGCFTYGEIADMIEMFILRKGGKK